MPEVKGGLAGALAGTAAVLVWLQSPELSWPARAWLAMLLGPLPVLTIMQAQQIATLDELPRRAAYISSMLSLWVLAALTMIAAALGGVAPAQLGLNALPLWQTAGWTVLLTAAGVAVLFAFRLAGVREAPLIRELMPQAPGDRVFFAGLSMTAGITEEVVFRGFLIYALSLATGSVILALLLSSGVFGVVHAYQRPAGVLRAALLGALLAAPLLVHGSIYPAILAHAALDLLAGFWLARHLLR
jgi:uncharacterized protein